MHFLKLSYKGVNMSNMLKKIAGITMIAGLSVSMVSCGNNKDDEFTGPEFTGVTEAPVLRAEEGFINNFTSKQTLKDEKKYTEDNFIALSETGNEFEITGYGTMEKFTDQTTGEELYPAEGEKFHVINYLFSGNPSQQSFGGSETGDKVSVSVNGDKNELQDKLAPEGALLVSASEKAEIAIDIQTKGITQSIDMMTAKRLTEGVADVWYAQTKATLSEPSVNVPVQVGKNTVTLTYSVSSAYRSAYVAQDGLNWADNGRQAYVVVDMTKAKWIVKGADPTNKKDIARLVDSKGTSYSPVATMDNYSDAGQLVFMVPADENTFTLHTENYADITYFGDIVGNTGNIVLDQVKIDFTEAK